VNRDGYADFAATGTIGNGSTVIYVFHGGPSGLTAAPTTISDPGPGTAGPFGSSIDCSADFNGDGYADLFASGSATGLLYAYPGSASGLASTPVTTMDVTFATQQIEFRTGDFNGDGYADVVMTTGSEPPQLFFVPGRPIWDLTENGVLQPTGTTVYVPIAVGDLNRDGFDDVVLSQVAGGNTFVVAAFGATSLFGISTQSIPAPSAALPLMDTALDLDLDGTPDAVTVFNQSIYFSHGTGTGIGTFVSVPFAGVTGIGPFAISR
jgi:hypothetical protein